MRTLIVEDDVALARLLKQALEGDAHKVEIATDGESGRAMVGAVEWDLLLLDLTLPRLDGFEVLKKACAQHREMRILVLSGRSRIEDRVRALDEGADDFLPKPFSLMELTARVRALSRRQTTSEKTILQIADLVIDRLHGTVRRAGREIELTPKEFALLEMLAARPGEPLSRTRLLSEIWKSQSDKSSNIVDVYINYIRKPFTPDQVKEHVMPLLEVRA